ncbi:hypothetical protein [Gilvimarinus chinensis]|uniref:hypothetical protein n=1 Tax=Gilvimarinus chinensis TaxID=396005 RepID=UPI00036206AF|nr:hypothetical protein [Gilvimarinus chinensis]
MSNLLFALLSLLPWVAGALVLCPLRKKLSLNAISELGYGYFAGATLLTVSAFIVSYIPWLTTSLGLLIILAILTLFTRVATTRIAHSLPTYPAQHLAPANRFEHGATALILVLITLHLGFAALEIYWRPVYPWDAWQTWMYTAKAWYFNGAPVDIYSPLHWFNHPDEAGYTAQGHRYPWLLPAQAWWLASLAGFWPENGVNWPTLWAAIALGLALWGQAISATKVRLAGPLSALLLLTMPLLGSHISLAGYADLWLAGFSGLGLIALSRGLLENHRGQLFFGLSALILGLMVKHDAIIWIVCALTLTCLLKLRFRTSITLLVVAAALLFCILKFGLSSFELQYHADFGRYSELLWLADSWHILWYILPATVLLALLTRSNARQAAKVFGLLLVILFASQLVLFGATNAGSWVGTASSRLLLQISPLCIFALVYLAATHATIKAEHTRYRGLVAIFAGTFCLLLLTTYWLLCVAHKSPETPETTAFTAQQLHPVYGPMRSQDSQLELPPAPSGRAIVSTGHIRLDASSFSILDVEIDGTQQTQQTFFWRTSVRPQPFTRELTVGSGPTLLSDDSNWKGEIIEAGLILYASPENTLKLQELRFLQATPQALTDVMLNDLARPTFWDQTSINRTELQTADNLPSAPLLAGLWVLFCWVALRLYGPTLPLHPMLWVAIVAWLAVDARWLYNSYQQARLTYTHYSNTANPEALDLAHDSVILAFAQQVSDTLGQEPRRVIIVEGGEHHKFDSRRLKYALLPHAAYVYSGQPSPKRAKSVDAIIWLTTVKPTVQTSCPKPLQKVKPILVTDLGILCKSASEQHGKPHQ